MLTNPHARATGAPARRVVVRSALIIAGLALLNACASQGCEGCGMQPIPGGFPAAQRLDNAGQVRVSASGLTWLGANFSKLVNAVAGSGGGALTFEIPPSCTGDQKLCCDGNPCEATLDIKSAELTPVPQSQLRLRADAEVVSSKILFEIKPVSLFGWFKCEVQFDSTRGDKRTVGVDADIDLVIDGNDGNKLKVSRGSTSLRDFSCDDISIDEVTLGGWFYCNGADLLCPLFEGTIENAIKSPIESTVDGLLASLPTGIEGRVDLTALLSYFARSTGLLDVHAWGGGYAEAENDGISAGVMIGARAPAADPCVPDCDAPGASCQAPPKQAIDRVSTFRFNSRPDGKPFHVGIGVHKLALEHAAYGLYRSGALCLRMDSSTVTALKSDLFTLLVPSLANLTGGVSVPLAVQLRPQHPATVKLGKGTSHEDPNGETVIDDPLVLIEAKDLAVDVLMLVEDRWVRLMSVGGDLTLPFLLFANGTGDLQPILGDLAQSFTNVKVENSELLAEDPQTLALLFPSLLSVAGQALASGFAPIALPDLLGITLELGDGSITSVENDQMLAIFAQLSLAPQTSTPAPSPMISAEAEVEHLDLPEARAFSVARRRPADVAPAVWLAVRAAALDAADASRVVEWTFRVDGGFLRPWQRPRGSRAGRLVVRDPSLWLPGQHVIEVFARVAGHPRSMTAAEPVVVEIAPRRSSQAAAEGDPVEGDDGAATDGAAGCAVTGGAPRLPGWLFALAALLALRRRRPRRT